MTFEGQRETEYIPLVKLSPRVFKIDRRDLTNRVSRGLVCNRTYFARHAAVGHQGAQRGPGGLPNVEEESGT
jgi:hypothetical protein